MDRQMSRRAALAFGVAGVPTVLSGGRSGSQRHLKGGGTMTRTPIDFDDERFPVWACPDLLRGAAVLDRPLDVSCNDVVRRAADDPPEVVREIVWQTNYQTLFLGSRSLLHGMADDFVSQIRRQFEFDQQSDWYQCGGMIADLIRSYFPEDGRGLGTFSVTPMRRPALLRGEEERGIEVTSIHPPGVQFLNRRVERGWDPKIRLGGWGANFTLHTIGLPFAWAAGSKDADNRWAKVLVTRRVRASRFRLRPDQEYYRESWLCRAVPGEDEGRLRSGQIPAVRPAFYQGKAMRVRTTPIMNLGKIDAAGLQYEMLSIEIDAAAGGNILSVRHASMPWSVFLLNASRVEHVGVCNALRRLV